MIRFPDSWLLNYHSLFPSLAPVQFRVGVERLAPKTLVCAAAMPFASSLGSFATLRMTSSGIFAPLRDFLWPNLPVAQRLGGNALHLKATIVLPAYGGAVEFAAGVVIVFPPS
jgi:hypothetical protein